MTEEQIIMLKSYGFHVEEGIVKHRKTGVEIQLEKVEQYAHADDLRQFIVELLRNQCLWKRSES
ncbi:MULTISPECIES: hypothetical protein [Brevibacillus]|uniref:Uncharacterized protein n=1 Tax=Brevibacillus invocatus TaxID=173959 RepID=A0A3M8CKN9_9BACL|nr:MULTISPECIES: hypothetical protein [Brevibacillus]MCM3078380.1 hypothetical protein [Brevibacillus invocatus]MCM3428465.1 hypothetical protein [Brevibacillus invocatus]MDH4616835.1 hypothetical protein [Brevibacillus sp. AY1]RNB76111.1 hypothetical protein EDM52_04130 [Brevibacillus invocatus]